MKFILAKFLFILFSISLAAQDKPVDKDFTEELSKLWQEGKITTDQPFQAKIIAAGGLSPWSGYTVIYLREQEGKKRYLEAMIHIAGDGGVKYKVITAQHYNGIVVSLTEKKFFSSTLFLHPVSVENFVWFSPLGHMGLKFGNDDLLRVTYLRHLKSKQLPKDK